MSCKTKSIYNCIHKKHIWRCFFPQPAGVLHYDHLVIKRYVSLTPRPPLFIPSDTLGNVVQLWIKVQLCSHSRASIIAKLWGETCESQVRKSIIAKLWRLLVVGYLWESSQGGAGHEKPLHGTTVASSGPPVTDAVTAWEPVANLDQLYIPRQAITRGHYFNINSKFMTFFFSVPNSWAVYANARLIFNGYSHLNRGTSLKIIW